jgi:uncharacterized protein (DUF885 family)
MPVELEPITPVMEMRELIELYRADQGNLTRLYTLESSPTRRQKLRDFYGEWQRRLGAVDSSGLSYGDHIDHALFLHHLAREQRKLDFQEREHEETAALLPFAPTIIGLEESRRRMEPVDSAKVAQTLNDLAKQVRALRDKLPQSDRFVANRAADATRTLRNTLRSWFNYYNGYDPMFTWWVDQPFKAVDAELDAYARAVREKLVGVRPDDEGAIVGNPLGREALLEDLRFEMIPYTPEELIAIAEREFMWCEAEMIKASREMGFGDDWRAAMEHVKGLHVAPGEQTNLVRDLAVEAIAFLEARDLVTIPQLAKDTWRMEMMSPERQLVSPFFLGGETIIVSFPTNTMAHEAKLMSMRGNNRHFSRATVQHELIPGHHLQGFMNARHQTQRRLFSTPFWTEGWALYWEMLLWDLGFPATPEDKVGMLFWRMHRCARIVFSLGFHLGQMTPEECIDLLVERVGHERANAEGEVRRSFGGQYAPLYQAAYMLGGLQFRSLHEELVKSGKMTNREFHDRILRENNLPVEVVRAILLQERVSPDRLGAWRFAG